MWSHKKMSNPSEAIINHLCSPQAFNFSSNKSRITDCLTLIDPQNILRHDFCLICAGLLKTTTCTLLLLNALILEKAWSRVKHDIQTGFIMPSNWCVRMGAQ